MINTHWILNTLRNKLRATPIGKIIHGIDQKEEKICFIAATRLSESEFWQNSPLGTCLKPLLDDTDISAKIIFRNADGLPTVYNNGINSEHHADILIFLHDDIWLEDIDFIAKIKAALNQFDIVGIAGNTRRSKHQPAWLFRSIENNKFVWDDGYLSGSVLHGRPGHSEPSYFGPTPANCQLLDGVLLAGKRKTLIRSNLKFDTQFNFHFYDMDFCRSARQAGLTLGTWPLGILHLSSGAFGNSAWQQGHSIYIKKWKA